MKFLLPFFALLPIFFSSCDTHATNKGGQTLRLAIPTDPPTMDPRKGSDVVSSTLHFMLFEGLMRLIQDGSAVPAAAERYELSQDKKRYTFYLREATWSDGSPVTALDFEKSWKNILDPTFPAANAQLFYPIKYAEEAKKGLVPLKQVGVRALDERTLQVDLVRPTPYFLELIAFCVFFPVNHKIDDQNPNWCFQANSMYTSNGPFILKSWKHDSEMVLERNPKYWDKDKTHLQEIHISMIENESTVLQMYEKGELDFIGQYLSPLPIDALPTFHKKGRLKVSPVGGSTICAFNTRAFPFHNLNMRKAFTYAMNRTDIVRNITQLDELPALGAIPPVLKGNRERRFFRDHEIEKARHHFELGLKELGLNKDQLNLHYIYTSNELDLKVAQALQQQWKEAFGITVILEGMTHKILLDKLVKRTFTFCQTVWFAQYSDQMNILERYKSRSNVKNYADWENPKFISLLDKSFTAENPRKRLEILEEAEEVFMEDLPVAPIFHRNTISMYKPYVKNIAFTPLGSCLIEYCFIDPTSKASEDNL